MMENDVKGVIYLCGNDIFRIFWTLTNWCNYRCPYCCQGADKSGPNYRFTPLEKILQDASIINDYINNNVKKDVKISLIGGEVSFYDLKKIIETINSPYLKQVQLTTNASAPAENYNDLHEYCLERGILLNMIISHHPTEISLQDFVKKLQELKTNFSITEVWDPTMESDIKEMSLAAKENGWRYHVQNQYQGGRYTEIIPLEKLKEYNNKRSRKNNCAQPNNKIRNTVMVKTPVGERRYSSAEEFLGDPDNEGIRTSGKYCINPIGMLIVDSVKDLCWPHSTCISCSSLAVPIKDISLLDMTNAVKCTQTQCIFCFSNIVADSVEEVNFFKEDILKNIDSFKIPPRKS